MAPPLVIPVAHDFNCPWCWVGLIQAHRLAKEFGVEFDWIGAEIFPEDLPWPEHSPTVELPNRPPTPTRMQFQLMMDGMELPQIERPKRMRTFNAHQAVEFVKSMPAKPDAFVKDLYRAYWEHGRNINEIEVLAEIARKRGIDAEEMARAIEDRRFADRTLKFNAPAYKSGVFNVPTFWIGGERYAEQPYVVLEKALTEALGGGPRGIYEKLEFPAAPADRPYVAINMVATIDGKILSGDRDEPVVDLGSDVDHQFMKRIEAACDAVLIGAQTLRAAKKSWSPRSETRLVITQSGKLDYDSCYFTRKPIVVTPKGAKIKAPGGVEVLEVGEGEVDLAELLSILRKRGIERLLAMGGSNLNAQLFEKGLIDEIFMTLAPKIKLGKDVPTIADGNPLPRERIQNYCIVEQHQVGDELFLRYRRKS